MVRERLQKVLAAAGQGSRRVSENLIAEGRVTVNGTVATLGDKADPATDVIALDGERIHTNTDLVYLLLNKPIGVLTTTNDPEGRPTVMDLVPPKPRVFPIGRLDQDTAGLLLLTNDGELANRIAHPSYEIPKTYLVQIRGPISRQALRAFTDGIELDDGLARAKSAKVKVADQTRSLLELVLTEGRKREVRRMVAAMGMELEALVRTRVGPIQLGDIKPSKVRPLNGKEVRELYTAVGMGSAPDAASSSADSSSADSSSADSSSADSAGDQSGDSSAGRP